MKKFPILLINPLVGDNYEFTRLNRPLPLGLLSLASMLTDEYDIKIIDQRMDRDFDSLLDSELDKEPLFAGIHVMGGPQIRKAMDLSRLIKAKSRVPVVWGGAFPTMVPEAVARFEAVDFSILGEGEAPVVRLAAALRDKLPLENVPSLTYLKGDEVLQTPLAERPALDDLPDLPYDLLDLRKYDWSAGVNQTAGGLKLQMESTRGCSSRCIFCYNPFFYMKSWRALSAGRTVDRMETLVGKHGATHIDIIDDSFFEDLTRVRDFSREILGRKLKISYLLNGGKVEPILEMSGEDLDLLRESGCHTIHLGAESGSDEVLQKIAKGITIDQIRRSNLHLGRHGIQPSFYFICGSPGETEADLRQSVQAMLGIMKDNPKAKIIAAFSFTPFAQTPGFKLAQSYGMPTPKTLEDWSRFDTLNTLQPWLDEAGKRRVRSLFFLAMFIDDKINDLSPSPLLRFAARLYRPIARFRMKRLWLSFPIEEMIGRFVLDRIQKRGARKIRAAS